MIHVSCKCGKTYVVREAPPTGGRVKCPSCGEFIDVPAADKAQVPPPPVPPSPAVAPAAPPPAPPMTAGASPPPRAPLAPRARGRLDRDAILGLVSGAMLFLTLVVPWGTHTEYVRDGSDGYSRYASRPSDKVTRLVMSWHILGVGRDRPLRGSEKTGVILIGMALVGAWCIGPAVAALGVGLRGPRRSIAFASGGFVLLVLLMGALGYIIPGGGYGSSRMSGAMTLSLLSPLNLLTGLMVLALLVVSHVRMRVGPRRGLAVAQGALATALPFAVLVMLVLLLCETPSLSEVHGDRATVLGISLLINILNMLALLGACVLSLIMAVGWRKPGRGPAVPVLLLLYLPFVTKALLLLITIVVLTEKLSPLLPIINMLLLAAPILFLLLNGAATGIARALAPAEETPA